MEVKTSCQIMQVSFDVSDCLWTNAKIQALKQKKLLREWLADAIQEKINRENLEAESK